MEPTVHVKFMAMNEDAEIAAGIVMNCPSVAALRERLESMGAAVIFAEVASAEEVEEAKRDAGRE